MLLILGVLVGLAGIVGTDPGLPTLASGVLLILGVLVGLAGIIGSGSSSVSGILLTLDRRGRAGIIGSLDSVSLFSDFILVRRIGLWGITGSSDTSIEVLRTGLEGILGTSSSTDS